MRRRQVAVAVLEVPQKLIKFWLPDWLRDDDPQPDGTEERATERMVWAHQRWAAARGEWSEDMKAAGCSLQQINVALFPARLDSGEPDPRRTP